MTTPAPQRRQKAVFFLVAAVLAASGTAWFAHRTFDTFRDRVAAAEAASPRVSRVVAARDLEPGEVITEGDVRLAEVAADVAPASSLYAATAEVVGASPHERILAGEPVRAERLEASGTLDALPAVIAPGARAVTVLAERAAGLGGLLHPGDHVDVIVTVRPDSNALGADWVTETIVQDARVLAVGPAVIGAPPAEEEKEGRSRRAELVTLEATPTEAEMLAMSAAHGDLHLALRAEFDDEIIASRGPLVTNALVGLQGVAAPAAAEKAARRARRSPAISPESSEVAEVIEGVQTSVQKFSSGGTRVVEPTTRRRPAK